MKSKAKIIRIIACAVFIGVFVFSGFEVIKISREYKQIDDYYDNLQKKFEPEASSSDSNDYASDNKVLDLQAKYPDVLGWLTVDGTNVDYPFVQAKNNDKYLRHDLDLKYLVAGTLFMDYRCAPDFSDFSTVIYGHNMKNSSMFGTIKKFKNKQFFDENTGGTLYLSDKVYSFQIAAYMIVNSKDDQIYRFGSSTDSERQAIIDYIKNNSKQYRELNLTTADRLLILSTCSYDYNGARMVLIARL